MPKGVLNGLLMGVLRLGLQAGEHGTGAKCCSRRDLSTARLCHGVGRFPEGDRSGDFLNPAQRLVAAAARPELSRLGHTPW